MEIIELSLFGRLMVRLRGRETFEACNNLPGGFPTYQAGYKALQIESSGGEREVAAKLNAKALQVGHLLYW